MPVAGSTSTCEDVPGPVGRRARPGPGWWGTTPSVAGGREVSVGAGDAGAWSGRPARSEPRAVGAAVAAATRGQRHQHAHRHAEGTPAHAAHSGSPPPDRGARPRRTGDDCGALAPDVTGWRGRHTGAMAPGCRRACGRCRTSWCWPSTSGSARRSTPTSTGRRCGCGTTGRAGSPSSGGSIRWPATGDRRGWAPTRSSTRSRPPWARAAAGGLARPPCGTAWRRSPPTATRWSRPPWPQPAPSPLGRPPDGAGLADHQGIGDAWERSAGGGVDRRRPPRTAVTARLRAGIPSADPDADAGRRAGPADAGRA